MSAPLPAWPQVTDRVAERWFGLAPRLRVATTLSLVLVLLLFAGRLGNRSPWGHDVDVLVATRALPAGHTLVAGDLVPEARPERTVPRGAVPVGRSWVGAVTVGPLPVGVPVAAEQIADGGVAALLAPGRVAVAVPAELVPSLEAGRRVDLIGGDGEVGGRHVARDGRVLAADTAHVWIEVDRGDASAVSAAIAWGRLTVALLRP